MAYPYIDKLTEQGLQLFVDAVSANGPNAFEAQYEPSNRYNYNWNDNFHGVHNKAHKWQILHGRLATSFANGTKTTVEATPGFLEVSGYANGVSPLNKRKYGRVGHMYRPSSISGLPVVSPPGRADEDAAGKLISRYASKMSSLQSQVLAGESREAIRMIASRGTKVFNGAVALGRSMLRKAEPARQARLRNRYRNSSGPARANVKRIGKDLADNYLETVYGWQPLLSDIAAAYEVLHEFRPPFEYVKGGPVDNSGTKETSHFDTSFGALTYDCTRRRVDHYSVKYACMARLYAGQIPPVSDLVRNAGITLQQFVPTIWNLLPYSFLVDYFLNVNEVITGLSYYDSMPGDHAKVIVQQTKETWFAGNARIGAGFTILQPKVTSQASTVIRTTRTFHRLRLSFGLPLPRLHFSIPGNKKKLNIAALLASRFLR